MVADFKKVIKKVVKDYVLDHYLPGVYRRAAEKRDVDARKVVFVEVREGELSESFRLVHDRLAADERCDVSVRYLRESSVSQFEYARNCEEMLEDIASARVVFLNDASNVISCVPMRKETKVIQLWHACGAFKKFGMSTADKMFGGSREDKKRHPFYGNLSLVTVSSPEVAWAYVEAMDLGDTPEIVQAFGTPRTDVFFDKGFLQRSRAKVETAHPHVGGRKILLYAPTFRGRVASAQAPDCLDLTLMRKSLGDEWALVIKHHPFVKQLPEIPAACADFASYATRDETISELLASADVCVSDYSSLVFEYSLLSRPMAFFAYDQDDYDDWRGFYYSYEDFTPGPVVRTTEELIDFIVHVDECYDADRVAAFRDKFMSACDGCATDRVCDAVMLHFEQGSEVSALSRIEG